MENTETNPMRLNARNKLKFILERIGENKFVSRSDILRVECVDSTALVRTAVISGYRVEVSTDPHLFSVISLFRFKYIGKGQGEKVRVLIQHDDPLSLCQKKRPKTGSAIKNVVDILAEHGRYMSIGDLLEKSEFNQMVSMRKHINAAINQGFRFAFTHKDRLPTHVKYLGYKPVEETKKTDSKLELLNACAKGVNGYNGFRKCHGGDLVSARC